MKFRVFLVADADGAILHINDPRISRFIDTGGRRPISFQCPSLEIVGGQGWRVPF
jgi:hypothetical protein